MSSKFRAFVAVAVCAVAGVGQGFEVASVKPAASTDGRSLVQAVSGRLTMRNLALRRMILIAWDVQDYQLVGDPEWVGSEHYDVQAKADSGASVQQMEQPMLQALLQDRFRLRLHREKRELPIYELSVSAGGVKLQQSREGACADSCGFHLTADGLNRMLDGKGVTMEMLAANLSRTYNSSLGRNVIDKTGLTGAFDIHLTWTIDALSSLPTDLAGPSIRGALQEQLGLKLQATKGLVDVLVVDHLEKPSAN
ncbi:MAG TPA: TIGR03435 family protein [Bryobacteraceae bacterium]